MYNRRKFVQSSVLGGMGIFLGRKIKAAAPHSAALLNQPIVISTWDAGLEANRAAWTILSSKGAALDAVEAGVRVTEDSKSCCVGLSGNPDRDGIVTLDACIMDHHFNCGSVAFLERIKHPISVARRVMEKTPHVMLVGDGAQAFAVSEGFPLEEQKLSDDARKNYEEWLKKSEYKPKVNIENTGSHGPSMPAISPENHDTIGMVAMDAAGNLSGSCTTSGMAFKMRGRLGDSPIIGSGLYVDNEVGAVAATGQGEDVIRVCGSYAVVEYMRQGMEPEQACRKAIEKIAAIKGAQAKSIQVCFVALNKKGVAGGFALQKGFTYAVRDQQTEKLFESKYLI